MHETVWKYQCTNTKQAPYIPNIEYERLLLDIELNVGFRWDCSSGVNVPIHILCQLTSWVLVLKLV